MTLPAILSAEAEADLDEAAQWYERRSPGLGFDLVARVRASIGRIESTPDLYATVLGDLRRVPVKKFSYSVFYRVRADHIDVVAILHNSRDPSVWESRN